MSALDSGLATQDDKDHKLAKYASLSNSCIVVPVNVETSMVISSCPTNLLQKIGRRASHLKNQSYEVE